jgi:hypothetical protein
MQTNTAIHTRKSRDRLHIELAKRVQIVFLRFDRPSFIGTFEDFAAKIAKEIPT